MAEGSLSLKKKGDDDGWRRGEEREERRRKEKATHELRNLSGKSELIQRGKRLQHGPRRRVGAWLRSSSRVSFSQRKLEAGDDASHRSPASSKGCPSRLFLLYFSILSTSLPDTRDERKTFSSFPGDVSVV